MRAVRSHMCPTAGSLQMATIILQLDPTTQANPDADMRYVLPDLLVARSGGSMSDDGYDYVRDARGVSLMLLFLDTDDVNSAVATVIQVLKSERVLGNDLSTTPVAVEDGDEFSVVYPPDFQGTIHRPERL